jgi:ABC-type Mn2+/Zn2+ transport system permease subunit
MTSDFFGSILMVLWTLYVTVGFLSQVAKNRKDTHFGWSKSLFFLAYITYVFGTIYGIVSKDLYISVPYAVGFVFLNILLYQFFKYDRK